MRHSAFPGEVTRDELLAWYRAARARTRQLFDIVAPEAYYDRPIALRNPIVFYEGHLPGFSVNTLVKLALKRKGVDERLEIIFARGIDPEDEASVPAAEAWPSRQEVHAFADACDALVEETLRHADLEDETIPHLRNGEAVLTILEHELMHQETLLYLLHQLAYEKKRRSSLVERRALSPPTALYRRAESPPLHRTVSIPAGTAVLGAPRTTFGWDNEFPQHHLHVPSFTIDSLNVTNGDYLEYMHATGAKAPHFWVGENHVRGLFELQPMNLDAPVYVTHDEAAAYARWKGKRLPTEAEFDRAAYGDEDAVPEGNFDFAHFDPVSVGQYAPSPWGVYDLVGNGWEWTSTLFDGFPGFEPMPSYALYSADFFDNAHYVLKGASPVTARELVRRSFRNWFRPNYPYVYATFRCVQ